MKEVLISLICCLLFAAQGLSFEGPPPTRVYAHMRPAPRVSERVKDVDWSQKFLGVLKHLSVERIHHRLSPEEYTAKLSMMRDAILAKKYREEKKKAEEDRDSDLLRNTLLLEPSLTPSPTLTRINEFDRILNILDKLMIRLELTTVTTTPAALEFTQCLAAPSTLNTRSRKENDEILKALSTSGLQDISEMNARPEIQYKHQTERDVSQFENAQQYIQIPPEQSGYIQPIQPALNAYQPAPQSFNQPSQMQLYQSGQPAGYNQPAVAIYPPAVYAQQNQQSPGQSQEEESEDADRDTNAQDDKENSKQKRRPCCWGKHKTGCRRTHRDNGDENGYIIETRDQTSEGDEKTPDDKHGNMLDTVILFLIALVATQLCLLAFLIILKDKFIVCLQFKYGQIKMCSVSQDPCAG